MKFLIDECLHTTLVAVAQDCGHDGFHVNWLGLSGESDWDLMPRIIEGNFTFVTNNARDFRKLYAKEELHAGLIMFLKCFQRYSGELFAAVLAALGSGEDAINEVVEIFLEDGVAVITRYALSTE